MNIAIIGAGAAGCFAAIEIKKNLPHAKVCVYESQTRALAKVAITGGGRCNLTNTFAEIKSHDMAYPRGARLVKRLFKCFNHKYAYKWFETHGVKLVTQTDQCIFPKSQNAMEIVNTLLRNMEKEGVELRLKHRVSDIIPLSTESTNEDEKAKVKYRLEFVQPEGYATEADVVVICTGGSPKMSGMAMFNHLNLEIEPPVPSLFSLCLPNHPLTAMMGTVVENTTVALTGTKIRTKGPLLITHWGVSGPAILKLSSHAARYLHEQDYKATIAVNWLGEEKENDVLEWIQDTVQKYPKKQLQNIYPEVLNNRLWIYLITQCGLRPESRWAELGRKSYNKLAATLTNHVLAVDGKNRFKEEFVTCGGVSLNSVNAATLECRNHEDLYFAGEALDIDAITGGFNLQAAWTTGYVAARSVIKKAEEEKS